MNRNDRVLLALVALIACALYALFAMQPSSAALTARLWADGELVRSWPLDEEAEYHWRSGDRYATVRIAGGKAWIIASSCPDQYCVRQGGIAAAGQSVACLPNRLALTLCADASPEDADALDGVVR